MWWKNFNNQLAITKNDDENFDKNWYKKILILMLIIIILMEMLK